MDWGKKKNTGYDNHAQPWKIQDVFSCRVSNVIWCNKKGES